MVVLGSLLGEDAVGVEVVVPPRTLVAVAVEVVAEAVASRSFG